MDINNVIYLEVTLGPRYNSSTFMFYCKLRSFAFSFKKNVDKNVDRMRGVEGDTKNMKKSRESPLLLKSVKKTIVLSGC